MEWADNAGFALLTRGVNSRLRFVNRLGTITQEWPIAGAPGATNQFPVKLVRARTGEMFVVSQGQNSVTTLGVAIVHKFNRAGVRQWARAFPIGATGGTVYDAETDRRGNVIIAACSQEGAAVVLRANSDASFGFNQTFPEGAGAFGKVAVAQSGGIFAFFGDSAEFPNPAPPFVAMALRESDGAKLSQRELAADFRLRQVATKASRLVVAGISATSRPRAYALQANTTLAPLWSYEGAATGGGVTRLAIDGSDNVVLAGENGPANDNRVFLERLSPAGALLWSRTVVAGPNSALAGMALDRHNEIYLSALSAEQVSVHKYGPIGSFRYSFHLPSPSPINEQPFGLAVQPASGLIGYLGKSISHSSRWLGWVQPAQLVDDNFNTLRNTPITSSTYFNDRYIGDVPATLTGPPANGAVTLNGTTGQFTYVPNNGYFGPDSFVYEIKKPGLPVAQATVFINVTP